MTRAAKVFISCIVTIGAVVLAAVVPAFECKDGLRYVVCCSLALLGSMLKVRLPGISGTFSLSSVFILVGIADLGLAENLLMASGSVVVQCLWRAKRKPLPVQVLFSIANSVINVAAAYGTFHFAQDHNLTDSLIGLLALASSVLYVLNTGLLSIVLALVEGKTFIRMWEHWVAWSFPYYLAGAVVASTFTVSSHSVDWKSCTLAMPLLYLIYICYRRYVNDGRYALVTNDPRPGNA